MRGDKIPGRDQITFSSTDEFSTSSDNTPSSAEKVYKKCKKIVVPIDSSDSMVILH